MSETLARWLASENEKPCNIMLLPSTFSMISGSCMFTSPLSRVPRFDIAQESSCREIHCTAPFSSVSSLSQCNHWWSQWFANLRNSVMNCWNFLSLTSSECLGQQHRLAFFHAAAGNLAFAAGTSGMVTISRLDLPGNLLFHFLHAPTHPLTECFWWEHIWFREITGVMPRNNPSRTWTDHDPVA